MNKSKFFCLLGILLIFGFTSCNKNGARITIKTNQPEEVGADYARITGTIKSLDKNLNELQAYGCCLGKNPNPDMDELYDIRQRVDDYTDLSLPRPFEWNLGLLEPGTEYHFRAFAFLSSNEKPIFGEDVCFTTSTE